jgi:Zn-dependent protease with chaperone function
MSQETPANPLSDGKIADLLASHPPIARRIQLLYQMAGMPQKLMPSPRALAR